MPSNLTIAEATAKISQIDPRVDATTKQILVDILNRKLQLTQVESFRKHEYTDVMNFLENRLAQPHLKYLPKDQANGIWGSATTKALVQVGSVWQIGVDKQNPIIGHDLLCAILDGSKSNEPQVTSPANSYDWFQQVYKRLNHEFRTEPNHFNVCGIRGYLMPEGAVRNWGDKWNDTIFLIWIDASGTKRVAPFVASCDAGLYYYSINPVPGECAHLIEGQWKYEKGPHNGRPAFIQAGPVTVARCNTPDYDDDSPLTTDNYPSNPYWINIHMGWEYGAESVYNSSAGCQVIKSAGETGWQWVSFRNTLYQNRTPIFLYTLINSKTLKKIGAIK